MTKAIEAVKDSIGHWERMINWVKTQPESSPTNSIKMEIAIGENWLGQYCPLCNGFGSVTGWVTECGKCPLAIIGEKCDRADSSWRGVSHSITWGDWLIAAENMIKALYKALDYVEGENNESKN